LPLACIFFMNAGDDKVMKYTFYRHIHVLDFGHHGHFDRGKENTLCSFAYPCIFLRWYTYNSSRINRVFTMCDGGNMELRIPVGQGVVACMVAEWSFPKHVLIGFKISFYD